MSPALLRFRELAVNGGIIADYSAFVLCRVEHCGKSLRVFVYTEQDDSGLFGEKGPHALDAPTGLIGMNDN